MVNVQRYSVMSAKNVGECQRVELFDFDVLVYLANKHGRSNEPDGT